MADQVRALGGDVRDRILAKAQEKFTTLGFRKTSMGEVAAELGISKKTLYREFPNKRALFEELLERTMARINARCDAILASPAGAMEKLYQILRVIVELQQELATEAMLRSIRDDVPHLWQRLDAFRQQRMQRNLEAILRQGEADGSVRTDLNYPLLYRFFAGALREGVNPTVLVNTRASLQEAIVELMDVFLTGVLTANGRRQYKKVRGSIVSETP